VDAHCRRSNFEFATETAKNLLRQGPDVAMATRNRGNRFAILQLDYHLQLTHRNGAPIGRPF